MNDYTNGYRHVTLFGETEEQKQELNNMLDEKGYVYEENTDGISVAVKETIGKNEDFKNLISRVSESESKSYELYLHDLAYNMLKPNVENISGVVDIVSISSTSLVEIQKHAEDIINTSR